MQGRKKGCKKRGWTYLLIILFAVATTFLPCRSFSGDMEILLDKLIKKGILTKPEVEDLLKEMKETKEMENKGMEAEKTKTEEERPKVETKTTAPPEWLKNLPEWIKNPPDWFKNITFGGDFRLRYDRLDREPPASSTADNIARDRARLRLRLGAETQLLDNLKVGLGIASSENGNPRSNNQTFNSEWSKKSIWIDYAYAEFAPFKWLSLSAGKLRTNPLFRANSLGFPTSGLIWDPDLTPEGVAVVLNYPGLLDIDGIGLDVFMNSGFFILDEFSNGREPYMFGLQPGFNLKIMKDINIKAAFAYYRFFDIKNKPLLANQPAPGNTNTLFTSGPLKGNYQFDYDAFAASGEIGYMTPFRHMVPYVGVFGEYIRNVDGSHDMGWTGGVRIGHPSLTKFADWQLSYAYRRLERDAWLDIFPDDDFYQGQTNAKGHYLSALLGLRKNISTELHYYHAANISGEKQSEDRLLVHLLFKF